MKTLQNINDLSLLTKDDLNDISIKLFKRKLSGNKETFVKDLSREFNFYGNSKYDLILINLILSSDLKKSLDVIEDKNILMIKFLPSYENFLYSYCLGYKALYSDYKEKTLSCKADDRYIFNNQFNTESKRILEWEYFIIPSYGYTELTEARNNTYKCGYCGTQYKKDEAEKIEFCNKCRGSEHLEADNYSLLKLKAISDKTSYKNITIPPYVIADIKKQQDIKNKALIIKKIEDEKKSIIKKIESSKKEVEVLEYLLNNNDFRLLHGLYIFYTHTNTLSFNWRKEKITNEVKEMVLSNKQKIEHDLNVTVELKLIDND